MHKSEFITKGSVIAFVGHFSIHFSHIPQRGWDDSSGVKSLVRIIKPKVSHDPYSLLIRLPFFPIHPRPASSAHAFSSRGELSTQIFHSQSGISLPVSYTHLTLPTKA